MKKSKNRIFSFLSALVMTICVFAPAVEIVAYAETVVVDKSGANPSAYIYKSASHNIIESNRMFGDSMSINGNKAYCIGSASETAPYSVNADSAEVCTDVGLLNILANGYPTGSSDLSDANFAYATQMAIRTYINGYNINELCSDGSATSNAILDEVKRLYSKRTVSTNPTEVKAKIAGVANKTVVEVNGKMYTRCGPFYPSITNGELKNDYGVILDNNTAFASSSASPSTAENIKRYLPREKFYVYFPANTAGTVHVDIDFGDESVLAYFSAQVYESSSYQDLVVIPDRRYETPEASMDLNFTVSGETEPPEEPEPPEGENYPEPPTFTLYKQNGVLTDEQYALYQEMYPDSTVTFVYDINLYYNQGITAYAPSAYGNGITFEVYKQDENEEWQFMKDFQNRLNLS